MRVFVLSILLFAFCSRVLLAAEIVENESYAGPKVTISYSLWGGAQDVAIANEICRAFVQENPGIRLRVAVYPWGQYWTKLQVQTASGLAPDVISLYSEQMGVWIKRGALLPLDKFVKQSSINLKDYYDAAVQLCVWDNQQYCMPLELSVRTVVYSVDRLQERGIPPEQWPKPDKPLTWDEFKSLTKRLTLRNPNGTILQFGMTAGYTWDLTMFRMYGGSFFDRQVDPTQPTVKGNEKLIRGIIEVFQEQYGDRTTAGFNTLLTGSVGSLDTLCIYPRYAMGLTGPWSLPTLLQENVNFGLSPMPRAESPSQLAYINCVGIYSGTRHAEEAWKFIQFMASSRVQQLIGRKLKGVPALISAQDAFINNDYGIRGCEAFIYDLPIAVPDVTSGNSFIIDEIGKWWKYRLDQFFSQEYDARLNALRQGRAAIPEDEYQRFVSEMNGFIAKTVRERIPQLDDNLAKAFRKVQVAKPTFAIKIFFPCVILSLFLLGIIVYIRGIRQGENHVKTTACKSNNVIGFVCISPWLIGFVMFALIPILSSIYLSFTEWNMIRSPVWVGVRNYINLLSDQYFILGLKKTFTYAAMVVPISVLGGLFTAGLLTCNIRCSGLFKSIFYFPALFADAAAAVLWVNMFNKDYGVINNILSFVGLSAVNWTDEAHAFYAVILMNFFWIGGSMIIYYAGMKQIPKALYEAADIDGAGPVRKFVYITIPMLSPVILFTVIMTTIGAFQVFTPAIFFVDYSWDIGGPGDALKFYSVSIYNEAFNNLRMGSACSYAIILFLIIFVITMIQLRLSRRFVHTEDLR